MSISSVRAAQRNFNALPLPFSFKGSERLHKQQQRANYTGPQFTAFTFSQSVRQNSRPSVSSRSEFYTKKKSTRDYSTTNSSKPVPKIKYSAAAAYSAKNHYYRPHYHWSYESQDSSKFRFPAGQDSFFVAGIQNSASLAVGVADGVGGWSDSNIDSAIFARSLCDNMARSVSSAHGQFSAEVEGPQKLLELGYKAVMKDSDVIGGGSTACIAIACEKSGVTVANLGDSGFVQIRLNAIRFRSEAQQHSFNAPFQLSKLPPQLRRQALLFGGQMYSERPKDADITCHEAQHGDVFIFATDGVWDNLTSGSILEITNRVMVTSNAWKETEDGLAVQDNMSRVQGVVAENPQSKSVEAVLASAVVREAKMASLDRRRDSPFAKRSREEEPYYAWRGGKIDDICVIVLLAQRA